MLGSVGPRCARARPLLQALAAEVVALEEQVLRLKSSTLRDRSEASGATEVARAMQVGCPARGWVWVLVCVWVPVLGKGEGGRGGGWGGGLEGWVCVCVRGGVVGAAALP